MRLNSHKAPWLAWIATVLFTPSVVAAPYSYHFHGFLSQSYIKSQSNNFFGESSGDGSFDFREWGVNSLARISPRFHLSAQLLYREAGGSDTGDAQMDFALADFRIQNRPRYQTGIRAGRIKNPLGLYNDTRDMVFTRPGVILPQSIYFDRVRDFALSSNGVQLYGLNKLGEADVSYQLGVARPTTTQNTEVALFSENLPGTLQADTSFIGRVMVDLLSNRLRLAFSSVALNLDYQATAQEGGDDGRIQFDPYIISAQLNFKDLVLTSEYARRDFAFNHLSAYVPYSHLSGESYYLQALYFMHYNLRILLRYDVTYLNRRDRSGEEFERLTAGARPSHSQFSRDGTLGFQWFFHHSWVLMLENHWIDGTAWLPVQDNKDNADLQRHWWMFNILVSYRF